MVVNLHPALPGELPHINTDGAQGQFPAGSMAPKIDAGENAIGSGGAVGGRCGLPDAGQPIESDCHDLRIAFGTDRSKTVALFVEPTNQQW